MDTRHDTLRFELDDITDDSTLDRGILGNYTVHNPGNGKRWTLWGKHLSSRSYSTREAEAFVAGAHVANVHHVIDHECPCLAKP